MVDNSIFDGPVLYDPASRALHASILVLDPRSSLFKFCVSQQQSIWANKILAVVKIFAELVHHAPSLSSAVDACT